MMVLNSDSPTPGPDVWWTAEENMNLAHSRSSDSTSVLCIGGHRKGKQQPATNQQGKKEGRMDGWKGALDRYTLSLACITTVDSHTHIEIHTQTHARTTHTTNHS